MIYRTALVVALVVGAITFFIDKVVFTNDEQPIEENRVSSLAKNVTVDNAGTALVNTSIEPAMRVATGNQDSVVMPTRMATQFGRIANASVEQLYIFEAAPEDLSAEIYATFRYYALCSLPVLSSESLEVFQRENVHAEEIASENAKRVERCQYVYLRTAPEDVVQTSQELLDQAIDAGFPEELLSIQPLQSRDYDKDYIARLLRDSLKRYQQYPIVKAEIIPFVAEYFRNYELGYYPDNPEVAIEHHETMTFYAWHLVSCLYQMSCRYDMVLSAYTDHLSADEQRELSLELNRLIELIESNSWDELGL